MLSRRGSVIEKFNGKSSTISPSRLADKAVETVTTRGPYRIFQVGAWVEVSSAAPRQKVINVPAKLQSQHGLLSVVNSLRRFFFSRECPWKNGTGAVEGAVTIKGGSIQRGWACPYCLRDDGKGGKVRLQHWGCVACFLDAKSRKSIGVLSLMNTLATSTGRRSSAKSEAAVTAASREGNT